MDIDVLIEEIDQLRNDFEKLHLSTKDLLGLVSHFRLDWGGDAGYSDDFDMGATKPILLSSLSKSKHSTHTNNSLFQNSTTAKLLIDSFLDKNLLSKEILCKIHKQIIKDGGQWRSENVTTYNSNNLISPNFSKVREIDRDMKDLLAWYNEQIRLRQLHPLLLSAYFHYQLVRIHPFIDGNGRLARIITSLILLSYNIPPPITQTEDRGTYLNSMRNADAGDLSPFVRFLGLKIHDSLEYVLSLKYRSNV